MQSVQPQTDDTSFTFQVDNVPPKQRDPYLIDFNSAFKRLVGQSLELVDSSHQNDTSKRFVEVDYRMTGAVKAIHSAYMGHYNLKLSVSDFILMIGQGIAHHMELHAQELRSHFVNFEGKERMMAVDTGIRQPVKPVLGQLV